MDSFDRYESTVYCVKIRRRAIYLGFEKSGDSLQKNSGSKPMRFKIVMGKVDIFQTPASALL